MSEPPPVRDLGARMRQLRSQWPDLTLTQSQVARALGVSGPLLSSWENGTAVPSEDRIKTFARLFATRRSAVGGQIEIVPGEDLSQQEELTRSALVNELVRLREEALQGSVARPERAGQLGGRFWFLDNDYPVTILCTPLSRRQLGWDEEGAHAGTLPQAVQYATNPTHPNQVRNLANGDIDALLDLTGHIRAENPTAKVEWLTYDRIQRANELTGHLVVLGGGDAAPMYLPHRSNDNIVRDFRNAMNLPIITRFDDDDDEFGGSFAVTVDGQGDPAYGAAGEEIYRPRFIRDEAAPGRPRLMADGAPILGDDVTMIVRRPNPLNPETKITILAGIFSRGTFGAVKAFTDPRFRGRNEQWLTSATDPDNFWLLAKVPVLAGETVTPDLSTPSQRLRLWPPNGS